MSLARFKIVTARGRTYVGTVQGTGGRLGARGLDRLQRATTQGTRSTNIYEPTLGCVAVYPEETAAGPGPMVPVPIAGATVTLVDRCELTEQCGECGDFTFTPVLAHGRVFCGTDCLSDYEHGAEHFGRDDFESY